MAWPMQRSRRRTDHGKEQDGGEVAEEVALAQREACLKNDERQQHIEEELLVEGDQCVGGEVAALGGHAVGAEDGAEAGANDDAAVEAGSLNLSAMR